MADYRARARLLRLMGHPVRLQILSTICASDECVCHLSALLRRSQPYVSQQLAVLRKEGLIEDRKEGNNVFYGLAEVDSAALVRKVLAGLDEAGKEATSVGHRPVSGCYCPKCEPAKTDVVLA